MLQKFGLEHFCSSGELADAAVCTKKHFDLCKKKVTLTLTNCTQDRNMPWNKDGKNGLDDPNTSEPVILDWWTTSGNYSDFCNGAGGRKKIEVMADLSKKIANAGCVKERTDHDILMKIQHWEKCCKKAHDFADNTGKDIKERDGVETFEELVRKHFKFTLN